MGWPTPILIYFLQQIWNLLYTVNTVKIRFNVITVKHFVCQYCLKNCYGVDLFLKSLKGFANNICWMHIWNCTSYLELAILPCWCFLFDQPLDSLRRLVMMTRGLGDPVASAYCRLYMAHCAQKLPSHDIGICFWYYLCILRMCRTRTLKQMVPPFNC